MFTYLIIAKFHTFYVLRTLATHLGTEIRTEGREVLAPELSDIDTVTDCSPGGRRKREEDLGPLYTTTGNCVVV